MPCNLFEIQDKLLRNSNNEGGLTSSQKWWASFVLALLFLIFSSPVAYVIISGISTMFYGPVLFVTPGGQTFIGLLVMTLIYFFIVRMLMW